MGYKRVSLFSVKRVFFELKETQQNARPSQETLLCRSAHGHLHPNVRGWQVSYHLNTSLTLKPLQEALFESGAPEIHHSDQGVQYLSTAYLSTLKEHGIEISLARRGHPWENGYAERLIRTLKEEEVHLNDYEDITEARQRIGQFITQVYIRR